MKKLIGLLSLNLCIGLGGLFAQMPTQNDSMRNTTTDLRRDSVPVKKNSWQTDSTGRSKNNKNDVNKNEPGNRMHNDSMDHSKMNRNHHDSMAMGKEMQHNMDKSADHQMNEAGTGISGKVMQKDSMHGVNHERMEANKMATGKEMNHNSNMMAKSDMSNWPEASKMAVDEITAKYGQPDGVTPDELFWLKKGVWKKICISKAESKHSFPIEHTDMMQTTISYNVPEDKMDDLGKFDGSVTFDRTQGTMSARCDKEANNFLALNLANDIIVGKKTVAQARKAYGDIIKAKMNGSNPAYMAKLSFGIKSNTADPDVNTTGLTKEKVTKAIEKNKSK